jgi:hypothetical protein
MGAASELGQRGNLAQVVASIERGGVGGAGEDPNLGMLRRLGATDNRGIDGRVGQIRELELRWRALDRKHQATALAEYLGTSRADPTIRAHFGEGQGGLAGVVLHKWQQKQAKGRARDASAGNGRLSVELERVRRDLLPLEQAIARLANDRPSVATAREPEPERPYVPLVLSRRARREVLAPYRAARAAYRAAEAARRADLVAWLVERDARLPELQATAASLRAEQARLCAQQASLAAAGDTVDDELALVKLCRGGLTREARDAMVAAATADVRALHRAWYATAKRAAKAWADEETAA